MRNSALNRKPPKVLNKVGRQLWNSIQLEYGIDDPGGLSHLLTACRSEDDIERMRETVSQDGDLVTDRFGQKQPHPLLVAIRGLETTKRQALSSLNLVRGVLRISAGSWSSLESTGSENN